MYTFRNAAYCSGVAAGVAINYCVFSSVCCKYHLIKCQLEFASSISYSLMLCEIGKDVSYITFITVVVNYVIWLRQIVLQALKFLEVGLEISSARAVMEKLFTGDDLLSILLSANSDGRSQLYGTGVLKYVIQCIFRFINSKLVTWLTCIMWQKTS